MSTTANYHWTKPTVGADLDTWGGEINGTLDNIDSQVKANADAVPPPLAAPVLLKHDNVALSATFLTLDLSAWLGYARIQILLNKVNPGLASTGAGVKFSTDAGATWLGSGYKWTLANLGTIYSSTNDGSFGGDTVQIQIQNGQAIIHGTFDLSIGTSAILGWQIAGGAGAPVASWIGGGGNATSGINTIKFYTLNGSATVGSYDVIGYL